MKKYLIAIAGIVSWLVIVFAGLIVMYVGCRIFVCDQFIIPSESMAPTLIPGDRILADKLIFGARIYKNYDFSEGQPLESWRMPRLRAIRPNDVLVFNVPRGYDRSKTEFRINYVFSKRCIGTPGDSVRIENGFYKNNRYDGVIGVYSQQLRLASTPDSLIPGFVLNAMPFDGRWTIKDFGPLYVPSRGDTLRLDQSNCPIYREIIEYETESVLDSLHIAEYVFKENYYFAGGDNVLDSGDGRYWGFVPEEFIIGVAKRISYSRDRGTGTFRRNRLWRRINKDMLQEKTPPLLQ